MIARRRRVEVRPCLYPLVSEIVRSLDKQEDARDRVVTLSRSEAELVRRHAAKTGTTPARALIDLLRRLSA